jgi:hypothetical protein
LLLVLVIDIVQNVEEIMVSKYYNNNNKANILYSPMVLSFT